MNAWSRPVGARLACARAQARAGRGSSSSIGALNVADIRLTRLWQTASGPSGTTDYFGHGYFVSNPRVSSDIIAMLRYGFKPNEPGRPLEEVARPFWRVVETGTGASAPG